MPSYLQWRKNNLLTPTHCFPPWSNNIPVSVHDLHSLPNFKVFLKFLKFLKILKVFLNLFSPTPCFSLDTVYFRVPFLYSGYLSIIPVMLHFVANPGSSPSLWCGKVFLDLTADRSLNPIPLGVTEYVILIMHKGKKFLWRKAVEVEIPSQTESYDPIYLLSSETSRWVETWWVYVRWGDLVMIRKPGRPSYCPYHNWPLQG